MHTHIHTSAHTCTLTMHNHTQGGGGIRTPRHISHPATKWSHAVPSACSPSPPWPLLSPKLSLLQLPWPSGKEEVLCVETHQGEGPGCSQMLQLSWIFGVNPVESRPLFIRCILFNSNIQSNISSCDQCTRHLLRTSTYVILS